MKGFFYWAGRALVFFILVLVGTEILLNVLKSPSLQFYRDQKLLHRYNPVYYVDLATNKDIFIRHFAGKWEGRFRTNSLGMRGLEEPDSTKPQLACLGDSLVMGFGVSDEDTFCHQLNGIELKGGARQTLNLAVDAYGSLGALRRLQDMAPKLKNLKEVLFLFLETTSLFQKNLELKECYRMTRLMKFEAEIQTLIEILGFSLNFLVLLIPFRL